MEGFGEDEIESVLYIGREVSGACSRTCLWTFLMATSLQDPTVEKE
jgi:hypothetical protein